MLKLLQGAPQELALDAQLVGLNLPAEDFDELAWRGARLLQRADCVDSGFAAVLQQAEPLPLGEGLWWLHSERQVRQPGLAFITPQQPLRYRDQPLNGLFCLASLGAAHQALLERLCEVLIEGRGQMLYQPPAAARYWKCWAVRRRQTGPARVSCWPTRTVCMPARQRYWRNWPKVSRGKSVYACSTARSRRCR